MKTKLITILLTVFFLTSCKTGRDEEFRKSICGEWIFAGVGSDNKKIKILALFDEVTLSFWICWSNRIT